MRTSLLVIAASLLLLGLTAPMATAAGGDCDNQHVEGALVRASVSYGGASCTDVRIQTCTLEHDPEYPGHPTWVCRDVI